MTREEAIRILTICKDAVETESFITAIDMAISALHFEADCRSCMWREKYEEQTEPSEKQVTSKLKNPCDSLLTEDTDGSKEQKSKLEPSDLISREAVREKLHTFDMQELYLPIHFEQFILDEVPSVSADRPTADEELQMWKDAQKLKDRITDLEEELLKYKSAERVVRCKDCERRNENGWCEFIGGYVHDGYCAWAKMKGGAE